MSQKFFRRSGARSLLIALGGAGLGVALVSAAAAVANVPQSVSQIQNERSVLHIRATKQGPQINEALEAWLDLVTHEGKIVQTRADGKLRRAVLVSGNTYTQYMADADHVLVRQGISPSSPFATRVRDEVLFYRIAASLGTAQVIGTGDVRGRATDRIRRSSVPDASPSSVAVVADVDRETGVVLREEATTSPGRPPEVAETNYSVIEYINRDALPPNTLRLDVPATANREQYFEGDSSAGSSRLYSVYGAPASEGNPVARFRRTSTTKGPGASDATYYIYGDGRLQIISGMAPDLSAHRPPRPGMVQPAREKLNVAGVVWEVQFASPQFAAVRQLPDSYVSIVAPDRRTFERVASSLRRVD